MENKHQALLLAGQGQVSPLYLSFPPIFALPWSSLGTPGLHYCPQDVLSFWPELWQEKLLSCCHGKQDFFPLFIYVFLNRKVKVNGEEKQVLMEQLEGRRELFGSLRDLTFQW